MTISNIEQPQRYALLAGAIGPAISGGDWVKYEDYVALIAEVRRMRGLLDSRPALNVGLIDAYSTWTTQVYVSDQMAFSGETKQ